MAKTKKAIPESADQGSQRCSVLVELENVAIKGRHVFYDVLKSALAEKGVGLDIGLFSRHCVDAQPKVFLPLLLKAAAKTRVSEEKLLADIAQSYKVALTGSAAKMDAGFKKLVKAAAEKGVLLGGMSCLDKESAGVIMSKLGLEDMKANVLSRQDDDNDYARANTWLRLAKLVFASPRQCVAVVTSAASARAALAAKMKCVVIPDKFTAFQDFGGADIVIQAIEESSIETMCSLLNKS